MSMSPLVRALVLVLLSHLTPQVAASNCSTPLVQFLEQLQNVSTLEGLAQKGLTTVQGACKDGKCPQVTVGACQNQSLDDINCPIPILDVNTKLGTDAICDAGCDDKPCKTACQVVDGNICYGADWIFCKAGCLGISSCIDKCEKALVDPCKKKLIDACDDGCETKFNKCHQKCEESLIMDIGIEVDRMQGALSSMSLTSLDVNCTGDQFSNIPMLFNASITPTLVDVMVDLKVHTKAAGISTTNGITLDKVTLTTNVPMTGKVNCVYADSKEMHINVGAVTIKALGLDVNLQLDKSLDTIVGVICVGLPFCTDAIKDAISKAIKVQIQTVLPKQIEQQLTQVLQGVTSKLQCPHIMGKQDVIIV